MATSKKNGPADLVSFVFDMTGSEDFSKTDREHARAMAAHLAIAIHMNTPAVWKSFAKARAVLEPRVSKRVAMTRGRQVVAHELQKLATGASIHLGWLKTRLQATTGQNAFDGLQLADFKKALAGVQANPARTRGGRVKGGKGNKSSPASILAALACSCGAWGLEPGDVEKARKLIGRD